MRVRPSRKLPLRDKACDYCAKVFQTTRPKQRFCCRDHGHRYWVNSRQETLNERAKLAMRKRRIEHPERIAELAATYRAKPKNRLGAARRSRMWHSEHRNYANPMRTERKQMERNSQPWKGPLVAAKVRARAKNLPFDLTEEWAKNRWTGKCELSGIKFKVGEQGNGPRYFVASIDRIRPAEGYTQSNSRFILWAVNAFKYTGTDSDVFMVAEAIMRKRFLNTEVILSLPG